MSTTYRVEQVLYCLDCDYFTLVEDSKDTACPSCEAPLETSGWFETRECHG